MNHLSHYVTVEAQYDTDGTELTPKVTFECPWEYGECRFYPTCDCEHWNDGHFEEYGVGHERVHHDECWMQPWFDNGHSDYQGDDADDWGDYGIPAGMNRSGRIKVDFDIDFVSWEFVA